MNDDFDALFRSLGLDEQLPSGDTLQATFVPQEGEERRSAPRAPIQLTAELSGTLPRLSLESPEAAKLTPDEAELEPLQILGEGGMGRVLLARQSSLDRSVAVKVLRVGEVPESAAEALIHEARTTGRLEHPSVVPIYALAKDGAGRPAVVMKRVEGVSWKELLVAPSHPAWARLLGDGRGRLAFNIEVLVQVCNAVAHAHQRGVIHRDVKPANVLLGELGEVYLADWGVALERAGAAEQPVRLVGTPMYLAPEMVSGDPRKIDERTDVYLLGATLHELLIGAPPHVGTDLREVLRHAYESPAPMLPVSAPPLLVEACVKALAADPALRFSSATALRDALKRYLQHRGASELAVAAQRRLGELEAMRSVPEGEEEQRRWYTLVSECRFGFKQALESAADHPLARDGLRRCLELAAKHELGRGAAASARAYLSELDAPPEPLMATLKLLEAQEAERAAAQAEMKRMSRELDLDVSRPQRTAFVATLVVTIGVMAAVFAALLTSKRMLPLGGWFRMAPLGMTALVYVVASLLGRKSLYSNRINRQLMGLIGIGLGGSLVMRGFSVVLGLSTHAAFAEDAVLYATLTAYAAVSLNRAFIAPSAVFLAGACGCVAWPAHALPLFGGSAVLALITSSVVMWKWRQAEATRR